MTTSTKTKDVPDSDMYEVVPPGEIPIPKGWTVMVLMQEPKDETAGGVILPDESKEAQNYLQYCGRVVAMGSLAYDHPKYGNGGPWCEVGDWVTFGQHAGEPCVYAGRRFRMLNDDHVKAIIPEPEKLKVYID